MSEIVDLGAQIFWVLVAFAYLQILQMLNQHPPADDKRPPAPRARAGARFAGDESTGLLARAFNALRSADGFFGAKTFLSGAATAYETVLNAYAAGNAAALKPLLGEDVYRAFADAIATRQDKGERLELSFVGIKAARIVDAGLDGDTAWVTVRFVGELVVATRAMNDVVVDGDPTRVVEMTDTWTFARARSSRDPNWTLVATNPG